MVMEYVKIAYSFILKVIDYLEWKVLGGVVVMALSFLFDTALRDSLIALLILIWIDFFTGVYAAHKSGQVIESKKMARSAIKTVLYFMMISAGFLTEKTVPLLVIDETILGFLSVTELISVIENTGKAGFATPKRILNQLKAVKNSESNIT